MYFYLGPPHSLCVGGGWGLGSEFAQFLAEKFGYNIDLISPILSSEKKQIALRPVNGCLDTSKIENELGFHFCDIQTGISNVFEQYLKNDKKLIFE